MHLIAGLGNPGKEYANTRHNVGFKVIDVLCETMKIEIDKKNFGAKVGKGQAAGKDVLFMKPWQYMNLSGQPIADAVNFYKINLDDVLVILDDMWLEPGQIRLREKGSAGGHNGLGDIIEKLGTEEFPRLRVGIGQSPYDDARNHVLGQPSKEESELINQGITKAKEAAVCWLEEGIGQAMTKFNRFEKQI